MKIYIVKKKASSLKEVGKEELEIAQVYTLKELFIVVATSEFDKQHGTHEMKVLTQQDIQEQAQLGRVSFGRSYNDGKETLEKAIETMFQDYEDGLFEIYINQKQMMNLDEKIEINDGDEVVFIRFIMLTGRLG